MSSFYRRSSYRSVELAVGPAYWPVFGWTALLAFAQTALLPLFAFRGAVPSFVTIAVVLYAVPGALIGIAVIYLEGMRRERLHARQ